MDGVALHADFETMSASLLETAQSWVKESGEFLPFAVTIGMDGEPSHHMAFEPGPTDVKTLLQLLRSGMRGLADKRETRAIGICYDGLFAERADRPKKDAIILEMEHVNGQAVTGSQLYRRRFLLGYHFAGVVFTLKECEYFRSLPREDRIPVDLLEFLPDGSDLRTSL